MSVPENRAVVGRADAINRRDSLRLGVLVARGVERFIYTYDYGDNWRHNVIVEEVRDGDPDREYPVFVDGVVPPIYLIRGASRTPTGPPALVMAPSSL